MNIRELPRRVAGLPVLKVTFLGWLAQQSLEPGYHAVAITYGESEPEAGDQFHVHLLCASGLDKPWRCMENHWDLSNGEANARFNQIEKLAEWPETSG